MLCRRIRSPHAELFSVVIVLNQVRRLARAPPPPEPYFMEEEACTDVLSLVQRCASSMDGVVPQGGGLSLDAGVSPLVSPNVSSAARHVYPLIYETTSIFARVKKRYT